MENFKELSQIILSYHFSHSEEFEGKKYLIVANPLIGTWESEFATMKLKAITELLSLDTAVALRLVKRLEIITAELRKEIEIDSDASRRFDRFELTCSVRCVVNTGAEESTSVRIITPNLIEDIDREIWLREEAIAELKEIISFVIEDRAPDPIPIYEPEGDETEQEYPKIRNNNIPLPFEKWYKISGSFDYDSHISNRIKGNKFSPNCFKDLFYDKHKDRINEFIQILRDVTPPLINTDGVWTGVKGAAKFYYDYLVEFSVIRKYDQRTIYNLFSKQFPDLGTAFLKKQNAYSASDKYEGEIRDRIEAIVREIKPN